MKLKDMINVMQHYKNGGEIEIRFKGDESDIWGSSCSPSWDWSYYDYRVKEQNKKVTIEKWLVLDSSGDYRIFESSDITNLYGCEPIKLLETYEVEI